MGRYSKTVSGAKRSGFRDLGLGFRFQGLGFRAPKDYVELILRLSFVAALNPT